MADLLKEVIEIIQIDVRFGAEIVRTATTTKPGANPNLDL